MTTPDRFPGTRQEDEIRMETNSSPDGGLGSISFTGTSFRLEDATGVFDPRTGGSGITEGQHQVLDTLVHDIVETSYDEVLYSSGKVSSYTVWTDGTKMVKVREELYSYSSGMVSQVVTKQYDGTGTLKNTMTEDYTYSGGKVASVTRTNS